jgi:hypothetical protein
VGTIVGLYFSGTAVALDALVLLAFKSQVLTALAANYTNCSQSAQSCYSSLFTGALPIYFAGLLVISFLATVFYGVYFEYVPGGSYFRKALLIALLMLVVMLNFVLPIAGDTQQELLMIGFEIVLAGGYAGATGKLYRRFTREVEFQSAQPAKLRVMLGRKNQTGKKRTFSLNSKQKVVAESDGRSFRTWVVSGGVSVDDPKNSIAEITVLGDGLLKAT